VSQLDRRQVLKLFGAAGLAAPALAACTSPTSATPSASVRVGFLVPQSGANKNIGNDMLAGFQLYLSLHGGQLGGHTVQLIPTEEGDSADTGRAAVDKLIKQQGVQVLAGVGGSAVMTGIRDQVESAQLPLIGSNASPTTLGSVKYIWRTSYVNNEAAAALGGYLGNQHNQSVFVVSDESSYAGEQVTGFLTVFNGIAKHPSLADDPKQIPLAGNPGTALGPYLTAIKNSPARAVFAAVSGEGAAAFFRAYRGAGITTPLYVPGFVTEGAALKDLGDSAAGVFTAMNYSADLDNQANRVFVAEYQKVYNGVPSTYAVASYDAGAVLDKALTLAGGDVSPQAINAGLSQVGQIDSPRGILQFNQSRTPLQRWYLRQVRKTGQVYSNVQLGDLAMLG
jgi:branched-chain amino acid transport system substrate-binding protein